jgi:hypothetical protein
MLLSCYQKDICFHYIGMIVPINHWLVIFSNAGSVEAHEEYMFLFCDMVFCRSTMIGIIHSCAVTFVCYA